MTEIGESIAVTTVADPEQAHWAQVEYAYGNGKPVQGYYTAQSSDGLYWSGTLNDQGQACLAGLPPGPVEFNLVPSDAEEAELKEVRAQIKTILDKILADERAQAAALEKELAQQSMLGKGVSHYGAYAKGFWNGAVGLLTFTKDVVVKAGQAADLINPVSKLNNLLQASYTSYKNGDITSGKWRQSLVENYKDEEFKDLAVLLGFDVRTLDAEKIRQIKELATEAYEIVAFIATDPESLDMLTVFAKDYAGAQSSIEWAEFAGGGVFEIVLTALLLAFTGGLGNVAQGASKIRHAGWLRSLGGRFRRLGELLRLRRLNKKITVGVDSKKKVDVDLPDGKKLDSDPDSKKKTVVRTAAQDREEVSRLSRESAEAKKAGNTALAEAKLAEARNILRPHIPKAPSNDWSGFIERLDVQAPKDGAVFWSGDQAAAQRYAESIGGTTLEATPGGNVINGWSELNDLPWDSKKGNPPFSGELWNGVSKKYANGAEGTVSVVQPPHKLWDQGTVWHNSEKGIIADKMMTGEVTDLQIFTTKSDGSLVRLSDNYVNDLINLEGIPR